MKKPKILIADDDRSITEGLGAILSDEGYDIEVTLDGQKAIDWILATYFPNRAIDAVSARDGTGSGLTLRPLTPDEQQ